MGAYCLICKQSQTRCPILLNSGIHAISSGRTFLSEGICRHLTSKHSCCIFFCQSDKIGSTSTWGWWKSRVNGNDLHSDLHIDLRNALQLYLTDFTAGKHNKDERISPLSCATFTRITCSTIWYHCYVNTIPELHDETTYKVSALFETWIRNDYASGAWAVCFPLSNAFLL